MYYVCMVKVLFNDGLFDDYSWEELSGVRHTTKEAAIKERYDFQYKEVTDGEYVHTIIIKEID